jgi:serine/threonine protein phosphatase 1
MAFIPRVLTLPENKYGRDFAVGDIHGCLEDLQTALFVARFDFDRDRLFSVGDLIDRGPDSIGVLRLLKQPWFFAVKGNHEDMFLDSVSANGQYFSSDFFMNGGVWILNEDSNEVLELAKLVAKLPHIIAVAAETPRRFNVVHGELVKVDEKKGLLVATDREIDLWANGEKSKKLSLSETDFLWERTIFAGGLTKKQNCLDLEWERGLSPTFCGHTIGNEIRVRKNHINLDTGAFRAYTHNHSPGHLTLVSVDTYLQPKE